jgi:hypothetical protein
MNRSVTRLTREILLICFLAAPLLAPAAAPTHPAIDGKTFTGTLVKQGENQGDPDDFVFKDGQFISTACASFGFKPASYSVTQDGAHTQFSAENKTDAGVRMIWKGTIEGDHLQATAQWMRPQQPVVEFHANANLKH